MKIYPKDVFQIDTILSAAEIYSVLDAVVEPPKWLRWRPTSGKKYQGKFSNNEFTIWRIISYRNSFLPIVEGKIAPNTTGSRIEVTMRLHRFVAAFMISWLGFVGVGVVTLLIQAMKGKMEPFPGLLIPLGMLVFGVAMTSGAFWWEVKKTKPVLIELLKGVERQTTSA